MENMIKERDKTIITLIDELIRYAPNCNECIYRHYDAGNDEYFCYFASQCLPNDYSFYET